MEAFLSNDLIRRVAATLGVLGSLATALVYVLFAALGVPTPWSYLFYGSWAVLVVLALVWWGRHPWRSFLVPVVGFPIGIAGIWAGGEYLGWTG